jgi:hypothetical protein
MIGELYSKLQLVSHCTFFLANVEEDEKRLFGLTFLLPAPWTMGFCSNGPLSDDPSPWRGILNGSVGKGLVVCICDVSFGGVG